MHHKKIIISISVITILFLSTTILYLVYASLVPYDITSVVIKAIPVLLLIVQCTIYVKLYNFHNYAIGMALTLMFFLGGDIFLALSEYYQNNLKFFYIGLLLFLIARIILTIVFVINPYSRVKKSLFVYKFKKWHIICYAMMLIIIPIYFVIVKLSVKGGINIHNIGMWILFFYILTCATSCFFSYMRYGLCHESVTSVILAAMGITLVTISDAFIGINKFVYRISYQNIIIMSLYWMGCLLLMWSIVRNWKSEFHEKYADDTDFSDMGIFI